ncbi:MAG: phosphohistidine phosphatase SixA [Gammaproteobacteria bacterium]|nr:phosphohistidine phosphatase SixA [Gammaproteobacteria bacterium]
MRLYLVQHGRCVDKAEDPERPLSDAGRREVETVADIAAHFGLQVDRIDHSGKLRAQQTAECLGRVLAPADGIAAREGLAPNDDVGAFASEGLDRGRLMVVGHLPFLERLAGLLLTGDPGRRIYRMQNAGILALERDEQDTWSIRWAVTPTLD